MKDEGLRIRIQNLHLGFCIKGTHRVGVYLI